MSSGRDEAINDLLAAYNEGVTSWAKIEMQTRDQDADHYEQFFPKFQTDVEVHAYTVAFAGLRSKRALEVGCGTGRTIATLNSEVTVGMDLSRESLLIARARFGDRIPLVQASATHLPFRPGVFDRLLCAGVLNHIPGDEQRALAVHEASRVLTRPARLVFSVHNYSWPARRQFPRETVQHNLFWHRFTQDEVESMFREALGHCQIKVWGICSLPRWRVGNRLGPLGKWIDILISTVGWLSRGFGAILVARVDGLPEEK